MSVLFVLLIIYGGFFLYLMHYQKNENAAAFQDAEEQIGFTVLIPFKDEERLLSSLIEGIAKLDYSFEKVEFLFINDHSNDNGRELLLQKIRETNHLDIQLLELIDIYGKKQAIKYGVSQAKYEYIVQLDADVAFGKNYLRSVANCFTKRNANLVLGSVKMNRTGNLLGILQHTEFAAIMAITHYTATLGIPIVANGANMSYTKTFFNLVNPHRSDYNLSSGDDVFLLYAAKKMKDINIVFNNETEGKVEIEPEKSIKGFIAQRVRWAQKAKYYKDNTTQLIGILITGVNLAMFGFLIVSILQQIKWEIFLIAFIIKWLIDLLFMSSYYSKQNKLLLILDTFLLSIFYPIYTNTIALLSLLYRPKWKGRKIQ